ncbi:MAG: MBOAT family protein [Gammaproteobacteria bacterium]|nr:MBOAT family protein [Gammaproteobacteria bacterium]
MNFNSSEFALFLPLVLLLYAIVFHSERLRDGLLLLASYVFYMAWYWQYAGLIAFSTCVDYIIGRRMAAEKNKKKRKLLLIISLTTNLGLLAIFKYFNFFAGTTSEVFKAMGMDVPIIYHELLLPVGISFYTFQTLSYTIDIYRGRIDHEPNFIKFATFVSFFPQLVAGPIVRAADFLPQLNRTPNVSQAQFNFGLMLVFIGLFKKIVIADLLAHLAVDAVFQNPSGFSSWDLLMALYAYTFQIYCDFSGYTDIAIGVAAMFGFVLPQNFNRPYISQSVREFWTRWHISLSSWLRDYLYISLGGNRGTRVRTAFNLMITMLLGGLWHGAAMNFIYWGGYHGLLLVLAHFFGSREESPSFFKKFYRQIITFHLIVFGWLLFRVTDMQNFVDYTGGLASSDLSGTQLSPLFYTILLIAILMHLIPRDWISNHILNPFHRLPVIFRAGVYSAALLLFLGFTLDAPSFIYFQF